MNPRFAETRNDQPESKVDMVMNFVGLAVVGGVLAACWIGTPAWSWIAG